MVESILVAAAGGVIGSGITAIISLARFDGRLARIETDVDWVKQRLQQGGPK